MASAAERVANYFNQWWVIRKEEETLSDRREKLRERIMTAVMENGYEDEKGSLYFDLPSIVTVRTAKGKTLKINALKAERRLTPAQPTPDIDKTEALLKEKGLWLTEAQRKALEQIQDACPFVNIVAIADPDAVSTAYYQDRITEEEYESVLRPQKESFSFQQCEL